MNAGPRTRIWNVEGLRTRYVPRGRLGQGLPVVAPWVNLVLLLAFFWALNGRLMVEPGIVVDLPVAPFTQGARADMIAVVLSVGAGPDGGSDDIVFFNDVRYRLRNPELVEALRRAMAGRARTVPNATLTLQADRNVPHGTVADLMELATSAGVRRVNLAVKPK